jgi:hypothetical protein
MPGPSPAIIVIAIEASPPEERQSACAPEGVQTVPIVQPLRFVQSPFFIFPRDAGEERNGGWNGLNDLNVWNSFAAIPCRLTASIDTVLEGFL